MPNPPLPSVPGQRVAIDTAARRTAGRPLAVVLREVSADTGGNTVHNTTDPYRWIGPGARLLGVDPDWVAAVGASGRPGQVHVVVPRDPDGANHGYVVGIGHGNDSDWRNAGAALARAANARAAEDDKAGRPVHGELEIAVPADLSAELVGALTLGLTLGGYAFRVSAEQPPRLRSVTVLAVNGPDGEPAGDGVAAEHAVRDAVALAEATALARDLGNTPSNVKNPSWLATTTARLAEDVPGLVATVRDEHWLADRGFGGVLAVGGGSASPPRLIELAWNPEAAAGKHLVLVGKGVTFDTGGISVKPADGMHLMRTDMTGGAAVIGAVLRIAALGLPVRVTGLVPCAENHVSGSAYRPGDVVRHFGGTTTEVVNTDAEGRMLLADALAYGAREHRPDLLVDVATLTGAMKVTLGLRTGGLFASSDELAETIISAGRRVGEDWWRMPLIDDHAEDVRSTIADLRQAHPGSPGSIFAALFLREFTAGLPWAHLDIAGPARADRPVAELTPVATGFAARTLVELARTLGR